MKGGKRPPLGKKSGRDMGREWHFVDSFDSTRLILKVNRHFVISERGKAQSTMPRSTRSRQAVKRTVLGAVNDDTAASNGAGAIGAKAAAAGSTTSTNNANSNSVEIPTSGIDGTSRAQIDLLLHDLESEVQSRIDGITDRASQGVEEQREAAFLAGIRLDRTAKKMTVGDFNAKFGCDIVADVMAIVKSSGAAAEAGKKRIRPGDVASSSATSSNPLETPAPKSRGAAQQAPDTILRTVRRGEAVL